MTKINIHEAKTHLSQYARMVKAGKTIILCDRNKPFAEIRPIPPRSPTKKRKLGQLEGAIANMEEFTAADSALETDFLQSEIFPTRKNAGNDLLK